MSTGFDSERVVSGATRQGEEKQVGGGVGVDGRPTHNMALALFRQFFREWRNPAGTFVYRQQLQANFHQEEFHVNVDMDDLRKFCQSTTLFELIQERPSEYLPLLEEAATDTVRATLTEEPESLPRFQVLLSNYPRHVSLREAGASHVGRLICVQGIIVSAGRVRVKATRLRLMCRGCRNTTEVEVPSGFSSVRLPRKCREQQADTTAAPCPLDPYRILPDSSTYTDEQRLKLQETPETVPTSEMPRTLGLSLDRYLVGKLVAGSRVSIIGVFDTYGVRKSKQMQQTRDVGLRAPYIRVLGIVRDSDARQSVVGHFTADQEEQMRELSQSPDLYKRIYQSIAPAIFGHDNIKRALACQLFGGSAKRLPDGMRLRGDINVLLFGDPSVGKSQFLKFLVEAAPVGVYTSGKGSSAAGLTASVLRDPTTGEFHLEGGALVLGDGGLVCIDEFDKMREADRVAIHEAMEQQTISIAKAGITTTLNSRTSVLAAANPVFSSYDDAKTLSENVDFQSTILSRFDLIFFVRDVQDREHDRRLAQHIINVHQRREEALAAMNTTTAGMLALPTLRMYVSYARKRCHPRLSQQTARRLQAQYVRIRSEIRKAQDRGSPLRMTVRQLEAIIRISESLARMELRNVVEERHVTEALRLFKVSTYQAATTRKSDDAQVGTEDLARARRAIRAKVGIGESISEPRLVTKMVREHNEVAVRAAFRLLLSSREFIKVPGHATKYRRVR